MPPSAEQFTPWMLQALDQLPGDPAEAQNARYRALVDGVAQRLAEADDRGGVWRALPAEIAARFREVGWEWNGIYARRERILELVAAAGPPVCATLEVKGGVGSSGMCADAILMNQTLVARDVKSWPGYYSCDGESGLRTVAGMVCPIRNGNGRPIAVWDLDSVQPIDPADAIFIDRFIASLSVLLAPESL